MRETTLVSDSGRRDPRIVRFGRDAAVVYDALADGGASRAPAIDWGSDIDGEGSVHEGETTDIEVGRSHILFPMAVGAIFLAMLVAGALLG